MRNRKAAKKWANDVIAAAIVTTGCGGSIIATNDLTPPDACDATGDRAIDGLTPGNPVDYLELRNATDGKVLERTGTQCKTATDMSACLTAVATITSTTGMQTCETGGPIVQCLQRYFVFTRGDQVGTVTTLADLGAFLAPVDTRQEAYWLVTLDDHVVHCTIDTNGDAVGTRPSPDGDGFDFVNIEGGGCTDTFRVEYHVAKDGTVTEIAREKIASGSGECPVARRSGSKRAPRGDGWFARAAWLEAASVPAFERLHDELRALGAPRALLGRARRAAKQEASHARAMRRLARRFGQVAETPKRERDRADLRDAEAVAIENAAEGCVRETFGAVFAMAMSRTSHDAIVRETMARIAEDELDHAVLARDVARFLEPRLSPCSRALVRAAREAALEELRSETRDRQARALLELAAPALLGA